MVTIDHGRARRIGLCAASILLASVASAEVVRVELDQRTPILDGRSFGERGAYELLEGRVHFAFDPASEANARVTDIARAPRGDDGRVEAWSELLVLQPVDPARRRGTAIVEVVNRGRRLALAGLNRVQLEFGASAEIEPSDAAAFGDGFLMEQGLTLVWIGWQADAPDFPGAMRLRVPVARQPDGSPIRGLARSDWVVDAPTQRLELAALGHRPHLAAEPAADENVLTWRTAREGERIVVPRAQWRFSDDRAAIVAEAGFPAGRIYELVYVAEDPPLVGLGFAAFRDIAAHALHDPSSAFPVERAVAIGSSQSGRFLRHFLYEGFNRDERGRPVYDGVSIHIGGAGRGGFDHRFSHPGRVGNPFANFFYPGDDFPFTSRRTRDLAGDREQGLLDRAMATDSAPKLFQTNTGYEYWGRAASLVHTTPDGAADVEPFANERLYHLASAPHYPFPFPPAPRSEVAPDVFRGSALDTSSVQRALLLHLLRWVEDGVPPPESRVPRIEGGTLVAPGEQGHVTSWVGPPRSPHVAYRQDFGPQWEQGIVSHQPPLRGETYGVRVPALDAFGSERTGIRVLPLRVPIGTYLPWALRTGAPFGEDEMAGYVGTFVPFARDASARRDDDPRPTLAALYRDRAHYASRVDAALAALAAEGWLLERDRARERAAALARWEWAIAR